MKMKEAEEEHLTRLHLQMWKKTKALLGPCGVRKGVRGGRASAGSVGESVWSPCGVRGVHGVRGVRGVRSPLALCARIGPIPTGETPVVLGISMGAISIAKGEFLEATED